MKANIERLGLRHAWLWPILMMCAAQTCDAESALAPAHATGESQVPGGETGVRRQEIRTKLVGDLYLPAKAEQLPGNRIWTAISVQRTKSPFISDASLVLCRFLAAILVK